MTTRADRLEAIERRRRREAEFYGGRRVDAASTLRREPLATTPTSYALVTSDGRVAAVEAHGTRIVRAQFEDVESACALMPHLPDVRPAIRAARELETRITEANAAKAAERQ